MNITIRIPSHLYENNPGVTRARADQLAVRYIGRRLLRATNHTPGESAIKAGLVLDEILPFGEGTQDVAFIYRCAPEVAA